MTGKQKRSDKSYKDISDLVSHTIAPKRELYLKPNNKYIILYIVANVNSNAIFRVLFFVGLQ